MSRLLGTSRPAARHWPPAARPSQCQSPPGQALAAVILEPGRNHGSDNACRPVRGQPFAMALDSSAVFLER
eukprot:5754147-Alexandrium_andersonii.AAC.1